MRRIFLGNLGCLVSRGECACRGHYLQLDRDVSIGRMTRSTDLAFQRRQPRWWSFRSSQSAQPIQCGSSNVGNANPWERIQLGFHITMNNLRCAKSHTMRAVALQSAFRVSAGDMCRIALWLTLTIPAFGLDFRAGGADIHVQLDCFPAWLRLLAVVFFPRSRGSAISPLFSGPELGHYCPSGRRCRDPLTAARSPLLQANYGELYAFQH